MKLVRSALLVITAALLAPAGASAATTIGSSLPEWTGDTVECIDPGGCTFVPKTIAGKPVAVPYNGVIVRWSARLPSAPDTGSVVLTVIRPTAGGKVGGLGYRQLVAPSVGGSIVQEGGRWQVQAGDLIGVELDNGEEIAVSTHPTFDSTSWTFAPKLGTARAPTSTDDDDFEALFNATIEPDTDGDGYGDETQDRCPQLAEVRTFRCTENPRLRLWSSDLVGSRVVQPGTRLEFTADIRGQFFYGVPGTVLTFTLPAQLRALSTSGAGACTVAAQKVTCSLGTVLKRSASSVSLKAVAVRPGSGKVAAILHSHLKTSRNLPTEVPVDVLPTGRCAFRIQVESLPSRVQGSAVGDRMTGTGAGDHLSGLAGDDCLSGRGGADTLRGGENDDELEGGRGRDRLYGGLGTDRLNAVDGTRDVVRCGPGRDRARVDAVDSVTGCEVVRRVRRR